MISTHICYFKIIFTISQKYKFFDFALTYSEDNGLTAEEIFHNTNNNSNNNSASTHYGSEYEYKTIGEAGDHNDII